PAACAGRHRSGALAHRMRGARHSLPSAHETFARGFASIPHRFTRFLHALAKAAAGFADALRGRAHSPFAAVAVVAPRMAPVRRHHPRDTDRRQQRRNGILLETVAEISADLAAVPTDLSPKLREQLARREPVLELLERRLKLGARHVDLALELVRRLVHVLPEFSADVVHERSS